MATTLITAEKRLPARTLFPKSVKPPSLNMLKPGGNNKKLGDKVTVKKWQGHKIYSLTLEERATCPSTCDQWNVCYGRSMPFGHRFDHTHPEFLDYLYSNVALVCSKHPEGVVLRLHVLGDFFSTKYVWFWIKCLTDFENLKIFGYTHHKYDSKIGAVINVMMGAFPRRAVIRYSDQPEMDLSAQTIKADAKKPRGVICPEQQGKVASCADCALCWTMLDRPIIFLQH